MTKTKLVIPEPCHESWDQMTPKEKGRFCDSCAKVVVDFTKSSREEIIDHLKSAPGRTCGRFSSNQIDESGCTDNLETTVVEETVETSDPKTWKWLVKVKGAVLSVLAILGLVSVTEEVQAQKMGKPMLRGKVKMVDHTTTQVRKEVTVIEGVVRQAYGNQPIANANISVESGEKLIGNAFTDAEGKYRVVIRGGNINNGNITVKAYARHFETMTIAGIEVNKAKLTVDINLEDQYVLMGDVAYDPAVEEPPILEELGQARVIDVDEPVVPCTLPNPEAEEPQIMVKGDVMHVEPVQETPPTQEPVLIEEEMGEIEIVEVDGLMLWEEPEVVEVDPTLTGDTLLVVEVTDINGNVEIINDEPDVPLIEEQPFIELLGGPALIDPVPEVITEPVVEEPTTPEAPENEPPTNEDINTDNAITNEQPRVIPEAPELISILYPNPSKTESVLEMNTDGAFQVHVFDNEGRMVKEEQFNGRRHTLELIQLEPGVYHVRVSDPAKGYSQTIELVVSR